MKIGIDARLWSQSGVGRYIRNVIKNLLLLDHKNDYVLFVRSEDQENIKNQILNIKNKWKVINGKWKTVIADVRWHSVSEQLVMPKILEKENLDLVHFPYFSVPIFYKRPYVVTIHDLIIDHFSTGEASTLPKPLYLFKRLAYKVVIERAAKNARKIIVPTEMTRKEVVEHLKIPVGKVKVTYEGVDDGLISNIKFQILNFKYNSLKPKNYFLYVGNAYPHKNLERLIEAFSLIKQKHEDVSLVLVGKEDYFYKKLKLFVQKKDLQDRVVFYGEVTDQELQNLYKNAIALVLPSLMEGFGLTSLEAMANNCLVLSSNIGELREVCKNAALYFNQNSVLDLKEKLDMMYHLKKEDALKMKKSGKERASEFSWKKMAQEILKVYESCFSL